MTSKQAAAIAKVEAKYPQFLFTVFDTNDKYETVTAWGVGVSDTETDLSKSYADKPETRNGFTSQMGHTDDGNVALTAAMKAASCALWHRQPNL